MKNKNLIVQFKRNTEDNNTMLVEDKDGEYIYRYGNSIAEVMAHELKPEINNIKTLRNSDLSNLEDMVKHGYSIRLNRFKDEYIVIISNGECVMSHIATKDELISLLIEVNCWVAEFLTNTDTTITL